MIKSVKTARKGYKIYQNEKQKNNAKTDYKGFKRKIITEVIEEVCIQYR